jgi:hypothetical protein
MGEPISDGNVLYDARHGASILVGPIGLLGLLIVAVLLIGAIRNPKLFRGDDPTLNRAGGAMALLGIAAVLVASSFPFFFGLIARTAISSGRVSVWQGYVRNFEQHHGDHDLIDTYFTLGDKSFHFNSSPWLPGFHDERDEIRPNDGLRIVNSGDMVLRIERQPGNCTNP